MIKLKILFDNGVSSQLEDLGIEIKQNLQDVEERDILFFNIDLIAVYIEDGVEYSQIYVGQNTFLSKLKLNEIEKLINSSKRA